MLTAKIIHPDGKEVEIEQKYLVSLEDCPDALGNLATMFEPAEFRTGQNRYDSERYQNYEIIWV